MLELGVNIDHVATLRQARRALEPDPVAAAAHAERAGANAITVHLREDRRHIHDQDVLSLKKTVQTRLNLEMSLAPQIVQFALNLIPHQATLVPERREEITTEGGLDLSKNSSQIALVVKSLQSNGIFVSAFIDPDLTQVQLARQLHFDAVELHTGAYANATPQSLPHALSALKIAAAAAVSANLRLHAGHGLNYENVLPVANIPQMRELNIGHAIISRAIFTGLHQAVSEMKQLLSPHP